MKVAVVGASGFIGEELLKALVPHHDVVAISRTKPRVEGCEWVYTDIFSRKMTEVALKDVEIAFYLVHSMLPGSRLTQATFQDQDLLLADNFLRGCKKQGVKQIIYLSGIIPANYPLSTHLRSRWEVEDLFMKSQIATTVLRAGLIIGERGSSLNIIKNCILSTRLMLLLPHMQNKIQVVGIKKVVEYLVSSVNNESRFNDVINLGYKPITYAHLVRAMIKHLDRRVLVLRVPWLPERLLALTVAWLSKAPYNLILPLLRSTKTGVTAHEEIEGSLEEDLQSVSKEKVMASAYLAKPKENKARSVQRITAHVPKGYKMYRLYYSWISRTFSPFMGVHISGRRLSFYLFSRRYTMLTLEYEPDHSTDDRELLFVVGGFLASKQDFGRLEFRKVKKGIVICALHDYIPALPWPVYVATQALIHLFVMRGFSKFLAQRFSDEAENPPILAKP